MKDIALFKKGTPQLIFAKMAVPNVIASLVMTIYSIVDGIFIGLYVGPEGLAAINLCLPILGFTGAIINMISIGASVEIAMKLGKNKIKEASDCFSYTMAVQLTYALLVMILGFAFLDDLIGMFGVSKAVYDHSLSYLRIFVYVMPLYMLNRGIAHYIRTSGGTMLNMIAGVSSAALNIFLDYIFVVKFGWGTEGAALATCIAAALMGVYLLSYFLRGKMILKFTKFKVDFKELGLIIFNGSSEFFTSIAASVSGVIINVVIIKLVSDVGIAAFGVVLYLEHIIMAVLFGMGDGLQPAISFNYGANEYKRMWKIFKFSIVVGSLVSLVLFIGLSVFKNDLALIFIKKENVSLIKMTTEAIEIYLYTLPFGFLIISTSLFFTAIGKPVESIVVSLSNTLFFKVILILILPYYFGIQGVWLTLVVSSILSFIVSVVLLYRSKGKLSKVDEGEAQWT